MDDLPISPKYKVLAQREYVRTAHKRVVLVAVAYGSRKELRFYKLKKGDSDPAWKVDLARFSIGDIDFCRLVSDAIEWARTFGVRLDWLSLEQLRGVGFSVQTLPDCPRCHSDQVAAAKTLTTWYCQQCEHEWESD
jgi:hypothetical protein